MGTNLAGLALFIHGFHGLSGIRIRVRCSGCCALDRRVGVDAMKICGASDQPATLASSRQYRSGVKPRRSMLLRRHSRQVSGLPLPGNSASRRSAAASASRQGDRDTTGKGPEGEERAYLVVTAADAAAAELCSSISADRWLWCTCRDKDPLAQALVL